MPPNETAPIIQHAIQLAIAPAFLLTGIAALLGVMANRLARFFEEVFQADLKWLAGAQFVGVMVALIGGLSSFLREVYLATHTGRIQAARFVRRQTSVGRVSNVIFTFPEIRDADSKGRYKP